MTPSSPASARLGIGDLKHKPTHSRPPAARFGSVWIPRSADSQPAAENAAGPHPRKEAGRRPRRRVVDVVVLVHVAGSRGDLRL